jgi:peptide/nickel transport system permease protein
MGRFILSRLLQMIPLLLGISFITFAIVNLVPGSPINDLEFNPKVKPADREKIRANLGLDDPWYERYVTVEREGYRIHVGGWLGDAIQGDLGQSLVNATPVVDRIKIVLPNTLILMTSATLFALIIAVPLGIYSAVKRNSWFDNSVTVGSVAAFSMPSFWLGFLMIILFSVKFQQWGWPHLPVTGMYDARGGGGFFDRLEHLILPTIALGLADLAGWTRYIRGSMLEVIRQDYVRTASAKGLKDRAILYGHAFRNALLPLVTLVGLTLPGLFGGAFVVESIFAWNGMGRLTLDAARQNDYTLIMGTTMMFAVLVLIANLITDIIYAVLDPRIRFS